MHLQKGDLFVKGYKPEDSGVCDNKLVAKTVGLRMERHPSECRPVKMGLFSQDLVLCH